MHLLIYGFCTVYAVKGKDEIGIVRHRRTVNEVIDDLSDRSL